jgi:6-phosphogluconolactonase
MKIKVLVNEAAVAQHAAGVIAAEARAAITARGRFVMVVSGGRTPWLKLRALANDEVSWKSVHLVQVDKRVAPAGHADRP